MADHAQVADDLYRTAFAIAMKVARQHGLAHDSHRVEDMAQTLFLAGWQVWRDKGEVGFAKHRMRSRRINLIDDLREERSEPRVESQISESARRGAVPVRAMDRRPESRKTPLGGQLVEEFLNRLPERRRKIAQLRMAAMTNGEIAEETGISERTVDREIETLKKELEPWRTTPCH
jgi:RNA polymerase sigma factor (sigma-70 family)